MSKILEQAKKLLNQDLDKALEEVKKRFLELAKKKNA